MENIIQFETGILGGMLLVMIGYSFFESIRSQRKIRELNDQMQGMQREIESARDYASDSLNHHSQTSWERFREADREIDTRFLAMEREMQQKFNDLREEISTNEEYYFKELGAHDIMLQEIRQITKETKEMISSYSQQGQKDPKQAILHS